MAEEKKTSDDHGRGASRGRQSEFAHRRTARGRSFLKIIYCLKKMGALSTASRISGNAWCTRKDRGAHGHFVCTSKDISKYTTAKLFSKRWQEDSYVHSLLDGRWRKRIGGHGGAIRAALL